MTYPYPPTPRAGFLERVPPATQAGISAALLLPTLILYFVRDLAWNAVDDPDGSGAALSLAVTALIDVYFVVLVVLFARTSSRRLPAVLIGVLAMTVDLISLALSFFVEYTELNRWSGMVLDLIAGVAFVTSWGVSRRRGSRWYLGLIPAAVSFALVSISYRVDWTYATFGQWYFSWFPSWVLWIGTFAICCAICWALDSHASTPPTPPQPGFQPGWYPPPGPYPQSGPYPPAGSYPRPGAWPPPGSGNPW